MPMRTLSATASAIALMAALSAYSVASAQRLSGPGPAPRAHSGPTAGPRGPSGPSVTPHVSNHPPASIAAPNNSSTPSAKGPTHAAPANNAATHAPAAPTQSAPVKLQEIPRLERYDRPPADNHSVRTLDPSSKPPEPPKVGNPAAVIVPTPDGGTKGVGVYETPSGAKIKVDHEQHPNGENRSEVGIETPNPLTK